MLESKTRETVNNGILKLPLMYVMNNSKMRAPIAYLEKTKKKRDEPSSSAIFAELGTKANKTDETKTKNIPGFI